LAGVLLLGLVFKMWTRDGTLIVEISDPEATLQVLDVQGKLLVEQKAGAEKVEISVVPGKGKLRVVKNGVELLTKEFSLVSGGRETINARLEAPVELKSQISNLKSLIPPPAIAPFDAKKATEYQEAWAKYLGVPAEITNSIGMNLVLIPPGEFDMGSTTEETAWVVERFKENDNNRVRETPRHRVKITKPFYLGMYHVTQAEYEKVMGMNPSRYTEKQVDASTFKPPLSERDVKERLDSRKKMAGKDTSRYPVEWVTWNECVEFCRKLSAIPAERAAGRVYRLPTEAKWEYACRAGTTTQWYCGGDESRTADAAWSWWNAGGMTHPVGEKKPNAWGLYDMHGNAYQWCGDWFSPDYYKQSPLSDPMGPPAGSDRVMRGGDWSWYASSCRSAFRCHVAPTLRGYVTGFRVSVVPPGVAEPTAAERGPDDLGTPEARRHDREVAQWVLDIKGRRVEVELASGERKSVNRLPDEPFRVTALDLTRCKVSDHDMARLRGLDRLLGINLSYTNTGDETLQILSELPNLENIFLCSSSYTDQGLKRLGQLKKLKLLWCWPLTDAALAGFSDLEDLESLNCGSTSVKGPGLVHLAKMSKLNWFNLNDTPIDDAGLAFLPELKGLTCIDLVATKITDAGLKALTRFPQLVHLELARTKVSGAGLAHLAVMTKLQRLDLAATKLDDAGLAHLPAFPKLAWLDISATGTGDAGLEHLRNLAALRELHLKKTRVTARGLLKLHEALSNCKFDADEAVMKEYNQSLGQAPSDKQPSATTSPIPNPQSPIPPAAVAPFDADKAREHQENWAKHLGVPFEMTNSIGMKFALIPPGTFLMGSPMGEERRGDNEFQHRVTLTKGFYIGVYEVTRGQFARFVKAKGHRVQAESHRGAMVWTGSGGNGWKYDPKANWMTPGFEQTDDHPVVCITWNDAAAFADWLSAQDGKGRRYRLPTEAEWEYACRAGTTTAYSSGDGMDALKKVGWCRYDGNSGSAGGTKPVGQFEANSWGLYDMHGNAHEWCQDWWEEFLRGDQVDPEGPVRGSNRVYRSGGWRNLGCECRSAHRDTNKPSDGNNFQGFRLALDPSGG
jgi:formylglycine-generating enzyme required for sulfatase activity